MREGPLIGVKKSDPLLAKMLDDILSAPLIHANNYIDPIKEATSFKKQERYKILEEKNKNKLNK